MDIGNVSEEGKPGFQYSFYRITFRSFILFVLHSFFLLWILFIRMFDYPNNTYIILCIFPNQVIVLDLSFFVGYVSDELICERKYDPRVVANTEEKYRAFSNKKKIRLSIISSGRKRTQTRFTRGREQKTNCPYTYICTCLYVGVGRTRIVKHVQVNFISFSLLYLKI